MPDLPCIWRTARAFKPGRTGAISAIILHSSDGHEQGDLETLTGAEVSAHYYVTRTGTLYHLVLDRDTAFHVGKADRPEHSNGRTIGIEQEHIDGQDDWPDAQITTVARLVCALRRQYGFLPVLAHAAVAVPPGRKVDPQGYPWDKLSAATKAEAGKWWKLLPKQGG
jgi:N-acetyl-anhydromuramyl-L-alanine amidase AmpD